MSREHMFHVIYVFIICSLFHQLMMQTSKAQNNDKISRLRSFINQKYTTKTNILLSKKRLSRSTDFSMDYCYEHKLSGKGFKIEKHGLNVTLNCTKDGDWWSTVIKWKKPKSQAGMDDCVGYVVKWQNYEEDDLCAIIDNENITTYTIDSTKEWGENEEGDDSLYFIVFALPLANVMSVYEKRVLNVEKSCLEKKFTTTHDATYEQSTIISEDLSRTGMTTDKPKMSSEATFSTNADNNKQLMYRSKKPVVNKVIFSIVMTFVSLLILVIAVVLYHKKKPFSLSLAGDGSNFLSYHPEDEEEAITIAKWLEKHDIGVVIDKFCYIKYNHTLWSDQQLAKAEKTIMIVTPKYLKICMLHQKEDTKDEYMSNSNRQVCSEIRLIRDIVISERLKSKKIIGILIDVKSEDLPHWMSNLSLYNYQKRNGVDVNILEFLKSHGK